MSEPLYLLDTNVLLFLARGGALGQHIDARFGLRAARQRPLVCVVSHGEVWVLALISQAHPEGARNMGKNDLWIAASAKAAGATLLTTDGDFDHLIPDHLAGVVIDPKVAAANEK